MFGFRKLDPGITVTLPDRNDIRCFLSELRMILVDLPAARRESNVKESDYRISSLFDLSESETSVCFSCIFSFQLKLCISRETLLISFL